MQKKNPSAADNLIDSLLDEVKETQAVTEGPTLPATDATQAPENLSLNHDKKIAEQVHDLNTRRTAAGEDKVVQPVVSSSFSSPGVIHTPRSGVSLDASLLQSESLKLAQQRILDLEAEVDRLRLQYEELAGASEIVKTRSDELIIKISRLEKEKKGSEENAKREIQILKDIVDAKDVELTKSKNRIEELENQIKNDFKKVRIRERELENRLELVNSERSALMSNKDSSILDLKRKLDQVHGELDNYRDKCLELNKQIEENREQFKRTVRALRLALVNLEASEDDSYKKVD